MQDATDHVFEVSGLTSRNARFDIRIGGDKHLPTCLLTIFGWHLLYYDRRFRPIHFHPNQDSATGDIDDED